MTKETYKKEEINAYLLGALPEAKTEHFDELTFTDDDFVTQLSAAEKDLVDGYVLGELKGETLEKFKSYYLASPLRREKVEFAKSFLSFAEKSLARAAPLSKEEIKTTFWANLLSISRLQWGFAIATLALILFGGWLLWVNSRLNSEVVKIPTNTNQPDPNQNPLPKEENANKQNANSEIEKEPPPIEEKPELKVQNQPTQTPVEKSSQKSGQQPDERILAKGDKTPQPNKVEPTKPAIAKIFAFVLLPPVRGGNNLPAFSIPPNIDVVKVELQMESDNYKFYQVALQSQPDSQTRWQSGKQKIGLKGKNKVINVRIPANNLKPQIYTLQVSGISVDGKSEIIGDYPFKVVP